MRAWTSLRTASAIMRSRSERSRDRIIVVDSPMGSEHSSWMFRPSMVTPRDRGRSRAPSHTGQATSRM